MAEGRRPDRRRRVRGRAWEKLPTEPRSQSLALILREVVRPEFSVADHIALSSVAAG